MDSIREVDDTKKSPYRKAAFKAWRTMRREQRKNASKDSIPLEQITVTAVSNISHPETSLAPQERKYGKGLICQFSKTPTEIACGRFWELRWAFGCPLDCSYCYLLGTNKGNMRPRFVKAESILNALDEVFVDATFNDGKPAIFNTGELSDSLMRPELMRQIVDKFETQNKHKVFLLTKMGTKNVKFLLEKRRRNTICAWSINALQVAKQWERAAPSPDERIQAAASVSGAGYEVRVRIDPIFPVSDWKEQYQDLAFRILSEFEPQRIILGTPRGLWKTIHYAQKAGMDMGWSSFFVEDTGWGKKISSAKRFEIYKYMYDKLESLGYPRTRISICKETTSMLSRLGINFKPLTCQCYG